MIIMHESAAVDNSTKPLICPKCERGRLGHIHEKNVTSITKRGKPPPNESDQSVIVKCYVCRSYWTLTLKIE